MDDVRKTAHSLNDLFWVCKCFSTSWEAGQIQLISNMSISDDRYKYENATCMGMESADCQGMISWLLDSQTCRENIVCCWLQLPLLWSESIISAGNHSPSNNLFVPVCTYNGLCSYHPIYGHINIIFVTTTSSPQPIFHLFQTNLPSGSSNFFFLGW